MKTSDSKTTTTTMMMITATTTTNNPVSVASAGPSVLSLSSSLLAGVVGSGSWPVLGLGRRGVSGQPAGANR